MYLIAVTRGVLEHPEPPLIIAAEAGGIDFQHNQILFRQSEQIH